MNSLYFFCIFALCCSTLALPNRVSRETAGNSDRNIAGVASNIVATTILKGNIDTEKNYVFSPLGFTSILAILSEGARGESFREINKILRHPNDIEKIRSGYNKILKRLQGDDPKDAPQFKTWFYVYKNNTIEDEFRKALEDHYFVDVKDIDRHYYDWNDPKTSDPIENSKDIPNFEDLKKSEASDAAKSENIDEIIKQKECSKFDKEVDDKQYVEVPVIKEEINRNKEVHQDVENETIQENEKSEDVLANIEQTENLEIMQTAESHPAIQKIPRSLYMNGDIASVLSANSLVAEKEEPKSTEDLYESKILLFNGLYFRGSWGIPFQRLRSEPEDVFYLTETVKQPVTMMRACGNFKIGKSERLKSQFIELPYANDRYSLLVVMPDERNGLKKLIEDFDADSIPTIIAEMTETIVDLCLPKFYLDTTSRAEKHLARRGLISIFTSKADFSGISTNQKLHVDELVQHVSVRVDQGSSSENFLTAANAVRSKSANADESFVVDRPFLFFVRDVIDDVVIVAGKITNPPLPENEEMF